MHINANNKYKLYQHIFVDICSRGGNIDILKLLLFLKHHELDSGFYSACYEGNTDIIKFLIDKGDFDYYRGVSMNNSNDILNLLVMYGANNWGYIFICAAETENIDIMKLAVYQNSRKCNFKSAFYRTCSKGNIDILKFLIEKGAKYWNYGLNGACRGGHMNIVKLMIEKNANNWNEGLSRACEGGHMDIAKFMIEKGANEWNAALNIACEEEYIDIAKLIIEESKLNFDPKTELCEGEHWDYGIYQLCRKWNIETIKLIINVVEKEISDWDLILYGACGRGNIDIVKLIIEKGGKDLNRGLEGACEEGHMNIVNFIIEKGANDWNNGLFAACRKGHIDIAKFMIENGADGINNGLLYACRMGHADIIKFMFGINNFSSGVIDGVLKETCKKGNINIAKLILNLKL